MSGAVKVRSEEAILFNYWLIVLRLLEAKIPYDFITNASEAEITIVLAVEAAITERKNQAMARA
jgi:hypothetical protein